MTSHSRTSFGLKRAAAATTALLTAALTASTFLIAPASQAADAADAEPSLPLGDVDLVETRTTETLAPGVTLTRIVRGTEPAPPDQINTSPPREVPRCVSAIAWSVLGIDPQEV
jgi:hypothetical protein